MSEEDEIPETADGAIRGYIVAIGFTLALIGGELMAEKDGGRFWIGAALFTSGLPCYLSAALWKTIKPQLNRSVLATLNILASDARWWVTTLLVGLLALTLSPFIEQRRWPFLPTAELQSQLNTKQHELADIKRELQEERQKAKPLLPRAQSLVTGGELVQRVENLQSQLDVAKREIAETKRQLEIAHQAASTPAPPSARESHGPIKWATDFALVASGGGPNALIHAILFQGVSSSTVPMKDAYVVSELTGHKQQLMANIPYGGGAVPLDQIESIPPGANIDLVIEWKPPLSITDFLNQWGKIHFTAVYGDTTYETRFDEDGIRQKVFREIQGAGGPRVTKKKADQ
jgi:hypothetical protein